MRSNTVVLPAPLGPMMPSDLALAHVEVDAVDGPDAAEADAELADLEGDAVLAAAVLARAATNGRRSPWPSPRLGAAALGGRRRP